MNRKDMIIAAVLMNIGLLIVLVVTGVKREDKQVAVSTKRTVANLDVSTSSPAAYEKQHASLLPKAALPGEKKKPLKQSPAHPSKEDRQIAESKELVDLNPDKAKAGTFLGKVIVVKKGDVLEKIAKMHGVTVEEILDLNQLKTTRLQIGQNLKIPPGKSLKAEPRQKTRGKQHVVKEGENPWIIAKQYHIKVEDLLYLNHLTEEEAKKLRPGQVLQVE